MPIKMFVYQSALDMGYAFYRAASCDKQKNLLQGAYILTIRENHLFIFIIDLDTLLRISLVHTVCVYLYM